ncbi:MAG: type I DNA topoisomerase [Candidatus Pacebacteria bacterium]|nr:type I DNA topoisomerase [Candidatus Paceibacterota bacterium]
MELILVESPTKSKTLKRFLGKNYEIIATMGHVRDLPKNKLGIDPEKNFEPVYAVLPKAKPKIKEIKNSIKKADSVVLAVDEDREGEAIAWHLKEILKLKNPKRIVFHEITKEAILKALKNPREIDLSLVNAQQTRRILDRLVGYELSPFLWKKVIRGLSAGRVQSVAVRLIVDREKQRDSFEKKEYWKITAFFEKKFEALLVKKNNKKLEIENKKEADKIIKEIKDKKYIVEKIEKKQTRRSPLPPFTTSSLQQECWRKFNYSAKYTMQNSQQLYEQGLITYHRTDSLNLSQEALKQAESFIINKYGENYYERKTYKTKTKAQEAHEAIRPTNVNITKTLKGSQEKIYNLIWQRFVACQMKSALFDSLKAEIKVGDYSFESLGSILKFKGFLEIYPLSFKETLLPELKEKEILKLNKLFPSQHFTQPPPRYTEASLIKELEKNDIGRPSTYAPIITTILQRNYVIKDEEKKFQPTDIALIVNNLLINHFPEIVDIKFTANMEKKLDQIAENKVNWVTVLKEFYLPFKNNLLKKEKEIEKKNITEEETEKLCEICKSKIVIKIGRFGRFYACSNYPECKFTQPLIEEKTDKICQKCGAPMKIKRSRFGSFLGCSNYPECKYLEKIEKSTKIQCPKCKKGELIERKTKRGKTFYSCSLYPNCVYAVWEKPK